MKGKSSISKSSSLRDYAQSLQDRALADLAKMTKEERDKAGQKFIAALSYSAPFREQVFVDSIVQDIERRRKKALVAA